MMKRTIVDLTPEQLGSLADVCEQQGISRAEAIRRAVALYLKKHRSAEQDVFGLWRDRGVQGLAYQRERREEWEKVG